MVTLNCAGPDGLLETPDDLVATDVTDASGQYLFADLNPDLCQVRVDPEGALPKLPGRCPQRSRIDLGPGQSILDADFCFVSPGVIGDFVFCEAGEDDDDDGDDDDD